MLGKIVATIWLVLVLPIWVLFYLGVGLSYHSGSLLVVKLALAVIGFLLALPSIVYLLWEPAKSRYPRLLDSSWKKLTIVIIAVAPALFLLWFFVLPVFFNI
jgi:hypothetical protein